MSEVCVLLAEGFEEIEAVTVIDVLRRAGVSVDVVGTRAKEVRGSHDIMLVADRTLEAAGDDEVWDVVVLPGGMPGSANLRDDPRVQALLRRQAARGGTLAAICAAPVALSAAGLLQGRRATCYPSFADELQGARYLEEKVVEDRGVITSRGPGTAMDFALSLAARLRGDEAAATLSSRMLVQS